MIYYIINTLIIGFVGKFPFCRRFFQNGLFRTAFQKAFWVNAVIPRENHERHMVMCQKPSTLLVGGFNLSLLKMMEFVSLDDDILNIWTNKIHVPNHQPDVLF